MNETNADSGDSANIECPKCGSDLLTTSCRQYPGRPGIVDVGWKCLTCGHEFGFEG